ncbi:MAG: transposase [Pirellulaceae bacterium]|nr:transposase [Pirellulaceae bacterium]
MESVGAEVRYLPPYSPDLNPIENLYSKLKWLIRSEATRTVQALWNAVGKLVDRFHPKECLNYIIHAGYRLKNTAATTT